MIVVLKRVIQKIKTHSRGLRLLERIALEYICTVNWHKGVGYWASNANCDVKKIYLDGCSIVYECHDMIDYARL